MITANTGGMVVPKTELGFSISDLFANTLDMLDASNSIAGNHFTDPCVVKGVLNLAAENAEWTSWLAKVQNAAAVLGDQHSK